MFSSGFPIATFDETRGYASGHFGLQNMGSPIFRQTHLHRYLWSLSFVLGMSIFAGRFERGSPVSVFVPDEKVNEMSHEVSENW